MDTKKVRSVKISLSLEILLLSKIRIKNLNVAGGGLGGKKESGQLRFGGRERPFRAPLYVFIFHRHFSLCYI